MTGSKRKSINFMIRKKIFRKSIVKLGANNNKQSDKMKY